MWCDFMWMITFMNDTFVTIILKVVARDKDAGINGQIDYSFESGNDQSMFFFYHRFINIFRHFCVISVLK